MAIALLASAVAVWVAVGIGLSVWMPSRATNLLGVAGRDGISSQEIFSLRNLFKVLEIHAGTVPAQVVNSQGLSNLSMMHEVGEAMNIPRAFPEPEIAISIGAFSSAPHQATIRPGGDFVPETRGSSPGFSILARHGNLPSCVEAGAHTRPSPLGIVA